MPAIWRSQETFADGALKSACTGTSTAKYLHPPSGVPEVAAMLVSKFPASDGVEKDAVQNVRACRGPGLGFDVDEA